MRKAAKTAMFMAILTLGLKFLGFLREAFMAGFFGTSYVTDAYVMASNIPGILFAGVFTSVAVSYLPLFSEIVAKEGMQKANRFTSEVINLTASIALVFSILGIIFSDQVVAVFAKGFVGETAALTSFYLKITFLYVVFAAASALLEANLQYKGSFLKPVLTGYLQDGFVLLAIIVSAYYGRTFLAFGLLLGSICKMIAVAWFAKKQGFEYTPSRKVGESAQKIVALAIPVFIGSTVNQINSFVDKMMASGLPVGSVAALNYGYLLTNMITAMTISIIVTIIYPRLTQAKAAGDNWSFNDSISKGMSITLIIGIPCSMGAMLYSEQIVKIVYERGAFDAASTLLTGGAFFYYSIGLTFIAINALLVKVYYAMQDMRTPVVCGIIGALTNIAMILILVGPMAHKGLALATSIAAIVNSAQLYLILRRKYPEVHVVRSSAKLLRIGISAFTAVAASYLPYMLLRGDGTLRTLAAIAAGIALAGVVYLLLLKLFKIEELSLLEDLVRRNKKEE